MKLMPTAMFISQYPKKAINILHISANFKEIRYKVTKNAVDFFSIIFFSKAKNLRWLCGRQLD